LLGKNNTEGGDKMHSVAVTMGKKIFSCMQWKILLNLQKVS